MGWGWALIWVWLGGGGGGRLFEAERLLNSASLIELRRCSFIQREMAVSMHFLLYNYFIEDKTKYVLVTWRAFCGHFCLLVPGYNLNFRFLRTWSIYFFVFVVFVCMGVRMDKLSAKSLIICQHIINSIQERFVGQAKSSNCFYVYGFESNSQFVV